MSLSDNSLPENEIIRSVFLTADANDPLRFPATTVHSGYRPTIYGGQYLGQALSAAYQTLPASPSMSVHSLHGYFLKGGVASEPLHYQVRKLRDGGRICTRQIEAVQNDELLFTMTASFQVQANGVEHQPPMPQVAGPEGLKDDILRYVEIQEQFGYQAPPGAEWPIENRTIRAVKDLFNPEVCDASNQIWIRCPHRLPDDPSIHQIVLAFASDTGLLETSARPHGFNHLTPKSQIATIDHGLWFHRPFRIDEWLLYDIESPTTVSGRGISFGRIYNQAGQLVASTAQEGVLRVRD